MNRLWLERVSPRKLQLLAAGRIVLGVTLVSAGVMKGLDSSEAVLFLRSLAIDEWAVRPIVMITVVAEISIGLPYALGIELRYLTKLGALFFILLTCISVYAWQMGASEPCGCFGRYMSSKPDIWLVLRNALAAIICIYIAAQRKHRWALQNRMESERSQLSDKG